MSGKFSLPSRYGRFGKSVWTEYGELSSRYKPIDLGHGFPDFLPPKFVRDALSQVAANPDNAVHQYTRGAGHPRLVAALSELYSRLLGREIDPYTEIAVTSGAYHAIFSSIMGVIDVGDEVIIMEPYFDCYSRNVTTAGGIPRYVPLRFVESAWVLDRAELEGLFNAKTKAIIVNTPHNPLGKVFSYDELTFIGDLCRRWDVVCISDEVYEWLVYDGNPHVRMASLPNMWERTITIGSAGKVFGATGWKLGWAYGPSHLIRNVQAVHHDCVRANNTFLQEAAAIAFESSQREDYLGSLAKGMEDKRNFMFGFLTRAGFEPVVSQGGYFMVADWSPLEKVVDLSEEKDKYRDYRFTKWMTKNVGVQAIPTTPFYSEANKHLGEKFIRFCFVKTQEHLDEAAATLDKWTQNMSADILRL